MMGSPAGIPVSTFAPSDAEPLSVAAQSARNAARRGVIYSAVALLFVPFAVPSVIFSIMALLKNREVQDRKIRWSATSGLIFSAVAIGFWGLVIGFSYSLSKPTTQSVEAKVYESMREEYGRTGAQVLKVSLVKETDSHYTGYAEVAGTPTNWQPLRIRLDVRLEGEKMVWHTSL